MGLDKITQEHKCSAPVGSEECASCRHRGVCNRIAQAVEGYFAAVFANGRSCTEYEFSEGGIPSGADVGLFGGRSSQDVRTAITANVNGTSCDGLGRANGLSSAQMIVDDFGGTDGLSPVLVMIDDNSVHGNSDKLNMRREVARMADMIFPEERKQLFFGKPAFAAVENSTPAKYEVGQVYRAPIGSESALIRVEKVQWCDSHGDCIIYSVVGKGCESVDSFFDSSDFAKKLTLTEPPRQHRTTKKSRKLIAKERRKISRAVDKLSRDISSTFWGTPMFAAMEKSNPTKYKVGQVYRVTERPEPYYIRIEGLETPSPDRAQVVCRVLDKDIVTRFDIGSRFEEHLMQVSEPVDVTGEEDKA